MALPTSCTSSPDTAKPPPLRTAAPVRTLVLSLACMSLYEALKSILLPYLSLWQSHALTIACVSLLTTFIWEHGLRDAKRRTRQAQEELRARIETEQALRDKEEQYRLAFEYATHGMYRTTPNGDILLANPALLEMLGFESFEALATRNLEVEGTGTNYARQDFKAQLEAVGTLRGLEAEWKRQDGQAIFVRENARVVRGPNGEALWYEGSVEDITERKLILEALQHSHEELEIRVQARTADLANANRALHEKNEERGRAECQIVALNAELMRAYDATIEGWSRALDLRDKETEGHCRRVTDLTLRLACTLDLPPEQLVSIRRGALLHDIGKMGVPDAILLKPGPLTDDEWVLMRRHPVLAYEMLSPITFLRPALDIPHCHHEKWDGTGYPQGLAGEEIPLAARIFAVVDVWDAMCSDRPYRKGWAPERVCEHIGSLSGTHFDPQVVDAFLSLMAPCNFAAKPMLRKAA